MSQTRSHVRRRHNRFVVGSRATHGVAGFDPTAPSGGDELYGGVLDVEPVGRNDILGGAVEGGIHILPGSLVRELFAETIIPPEVVDSLPTLPDVLYPQGSQVFLTTDGKLYRNTDGSTWSKSVDGNDLVADSVVAGKIAAGAVGVDELAANSIQTQHFQATAAAPEVNNSDASVVIDPNGIVIRNGKLVFEDVFGITALDGGGFGASWMDFISSRFYNGYFVAGTTADITVPTLVGSASTVADYLASLSDDVPYWVVASESGAGTFRRVTDATAPGGFGLQWSGTETAEIFQDIPIVAGREHRVQILWRYTNSASSFDRTVTAQYRDVNHAALGASSASTLGFSTSQGAYVVAAVKAVGTAPPDARFLRVMVKFARVSGAPVVWLGGVESVVSLFGTHAIAGDDDDAGQTVYSNTGEALPIVQSGVAGTGRYVLRADGEHQYSDSSGSYKGSIGPAGVVFPSSPSVGQVVYRVDLHGWYHYTGSGWIPGTAFPTVSENFIASDVAMTNANQVYDGPSLSLAAGTYLLVGRINVLCNNASAGYFNGRLYSGATVLDEATAYLQQFVTDSLPVFGYVVLGSTTTVKISAIANTSGNTILADNNTNATVDKASHLVAVRIA